MVKPIIGIALGLLIGIGCRSFGIPLPGPPAIFGAILAVAMATGYTVTDRLLSKRAAPVVSRATDTTSATHGGSSP